ncbi:hypothetical protein DS2_02083 [Catenovulum agarivorans DS-2]|uniref:Amidoligase enzyme n=1 Tax=Catenovulum agarivorans DS-2 TaxID=1328313 RepID=W7QG77_9ALTE|nr:amidoligase family protein [Catenovulum agarivorans]EWH11934.1 hypothetical protein DS2_02083 [Catenovulum agarivorans DS-2]
MSHSYLVPTKTHTDDGERRVGFELEFASVTIPEVADTIAAVFDSQTEYVTDTDYKIAVDHLGEFTVELDWRYAQIKAKQRAEQSADVKTELDSANEKIQQWITELSANVVPAEVVCPPIKISQLAELDKMIDALRQLGASGTHESAIYAFGVHINPELPDLSATTILAYLQAYCIAQDWLIKKHQVDLTRRVMPYIEKYSKSYIEHVLNYAEDVSYQVLVDDYLKFNPSRNRALDLLPLFKHIDAEPINSKLPKEKINARPTFHYRLPNCQINEPDWQLSRCWNIWSVIEYIAHNPEVRQQLAKEYQQQSVLDLALGKNSWFAQLDQIHQDLLSA